MKSSTYYFHIKAKILADFQICISLSVPLINRPTGMAMKPKSKKNDALSFQMFLKDGLCKKITLE